LNIGITLVNRTQILQRITWEIRRGKALCLRGLPVALHAHHAIGHAKSHGKTAPSHQWTNPETWPSHHSRLNRPRLIHQEKNFNYFILPEISLSNRIQTHKKK
jgi:hypothetical protein